MPNIESFLGGDMSKKQAKQKNYVDFKQTLCVREKDKKEERNSGMRREENRDSSCLFILITTQ